MKKCTSCQKTKSIKSFSIDKSKDQGRASRCKSCVSGINKARRKLRGSYFSERWHANDSQCVKATCEVCGLTFGAKHKRHHTCDDCRVIKIRVTSSLSKPYLSFDRKTLKKAERPDKTTILSVLKLYIATNSCSYCKRQFTLNNFKTIDHVVPKSVGGSSATSNISICCKECNQMKGTLRVAEWIALCKLIAQS